MTDTHQIAIDGPAGAGKSSVAKEVARRLDYLFVDTGAMYRSVTALAIRAELKDEDKPAWETIARESKIELKDNSSIVIANGLDLTEEIRTPHVTARTKFAANNPVIREILVARQREMGQEGSIVMEGRDITTVVLPDASHKVYLDANPEVRAQRRYDEMKAKGLDANYEEILYAVIARDDSDKNRKVGPLTRADDATYIDSSHMAYENVVQGIINLVHGVEAGV